MRTIGSVKRPEEGEIKEKHTCENSEKQKRKTSEVDKAQSCPLINKGEFIYGAIMPIHFPERRH